jgi:hypothetical protein
MLPFDLHVLSMPPAFNLSQDQTLQFNPKTSSIYFIDKVPTQFVSSFFLISFTSLGDAYSTLSHPVVNAFFHFFSFI